MPKSFYILPASDLTTCSTNSPLNGQVFSIQKLLLKWTGADTFMPLQLEIEVTNQNINSAGHKYTCLISGKELRSIISSTYLLKDDFVINACSLNCGGLNVGNANFSANATLKVSGLKFDDY